jgi:hypothetical protein
MFNAFIHLLEPAAPQAYIDPSTGGMLFQILAVFFAFFSGILFFFSRQIKSGFARLKRLISDKFQGSNEEPPNDLSS